MSTKRSRTPDVDVITPTYSAEDDLTHITTSDLAATASARSPPRLALEDVKLLFQNLPYLPYVVLPLKAARPLPGVHFNTPLIIRDYIITITLALLELPLFLSALATALILPGWAFPLVLLAAGGLLLSIAQTTWSSSLLAHSNPEILTESELAAHSSERWIFVNGIATSYAMLQQTTDLLAATFKRPVLGVHNRSFGILGDLVECVVQRSFNYDTRDIRVAYAAVKQALLDPAAAKVVLVAHSQGGIIASMLLDRLLATLARDELARLEIYTFGSAAAYFHNPLLPESDAKGQRRRHVVPAIEHYVNQLDLVPRWGVLYHALVPGATATTYAGKVFVHDGASGHLFDQHYLQAMFPLWKVGSNDPGVFWNHRVREDETLRGVLRSSTFPKKSTAGEQAQVEVTRDKGRRVRDVSRLFRYLDGGEP